MTRLLTGRSLRLLIGLIALVQAIFLAESFTTLMETVVRNGGSVFDAALLLTLKMPEVMDFALPLVLLIGLYFAICAAREDNELIVCAAAGIPWTRIPRFALSVGAIGFVASILFAGFLTPLAKYTQRIAIQAMESQRAVEEITNAGPKNTNRTILERTFIATPPNDATSERGNLFIFEPDTGDGWRVSQADDWTVIGPEQDGSYAIRMESYRDYVGRPARTDNARESDQTSPKSQLQNAELNIQTLALRFRLDELLDGADRAARPHEQTLIRFGTRAVARAVVEPLVLIDKRFGDILARASLCVFAALLAVAAAAFSTTRAGRFTALPGSVVLVMGGDILSRNLLGHAGSIGGQYFWLVAGLILASSIILPWLYIAKRRETMIAPARGRA